MVLPNKCDIPNKEPRRRVVATSRAEDFSKQRGLLYFGECSAFQNINVRTSIKKLVEEIYTIQTELIKKGIRKPEGLKISIEQKTKPKHS